MFFPYTEHETVIPEHHIPTSCPDRCVYDMLEGGHFGKVYSTSQVLQSQPPGLTVSDTDDSSSTSDTAAGIAQVTEAICNIYNERRAPWKHVK